jgi:hypothetical protein
MKDALDMDLVLFCKRKQEDEISSGNIANQLKAAMTTALERRNIQRGNEILLRFIGDILRIASKEQVQYNWLSDSVKQLGRELDTNFPSNSGIPSGY